VVHVAIWQISLVQKAPVVLLDRQPEAVEIALELISRHRLASVVDHAELDLNRFEPGRARQFEQPVSDRLEHPLLPAMVKVALLDVGTKTQAAPSGLELLPPVVLHFEIMSAIEPELHRVLGHRITPNAAAAAK